MSAAMRPWNGLPIWENNEPLLDLPLALLRLEPHPYAQLGAPYGAEASPFRLRSGVIGRLLEAQATLQRSQPSWRLGIFDAWRPVAVQRFMVRHAIAEECRARGINPAHQGPERQAVEEDVGRFWAPPSDDPSTPPPHSTGAAVDLTLAGPDGAPLAMGGAIDAIGPMSEPDHWEGAATADPNGEAATWHHRRRQLAEAMTGAGFAQHPNEWWHFSHGDQLWAWRSNQPQAVYGRVIEEGLVSSSV